MTKDPKQSAIGRRSRRKGKAFECAFARKMTELTGMKWESTRNSGRTDLKGDIYCPDSPDLPVVIECKHRNEYRLEHLFNPTASLQTAIDKNLRDAADKGATAIIAVKTKIGVFIRIDGSRVRVNGKPIILKKDGRVLWIEVDGLTEIKFV